MEGCRTYPAASVLRMDWHPGIAPALPSAGSPHTPPYRMQEMSKHKARDGGNFCMGIKKNKLSLTTERSQGALSAVHRVLYLEYLEREQVK